MSRFGLTRRRLLATTGWAASLPLTARAATQDDWDTQPEIRPTESVVAPDLLRGPHYALGPTVTTLAYLNRYTVTTDYGPFIAPSDVRLRRLLREIAAIAQLQAMQQSEAFEKAAIEAGKSPFRSAKNLLDDPVGTLSAIPEGIGSIFNRAHEQLHREGRSRYEDGPAKQLLAVSSYKRDYAAKLGVDAYSSNEALQKELDRLAWASAAGNLTLGALSAVTGALALQVASNVRLLEQAQNVVAATPPSELSKRNREQLKRLAVPDTVVDRFLRNAALSPRHETIIVASMTALGTYSGAGQLHRLRQQRRHGRRGPDVPADGGADRGLQHTRYARASDSNRSQPAAYHDDQWRGAPVAADRSAVVDRAQRRFGERTCSRRSPARLKCGSPAMRHHVPNPGWHSRD